MKRLLLTIILMVSLLLSACSNGSPTPSGNNASETKNTDAQTSEATSESTMPSANNGDKLISPSDDYVISCLRNVADITDIEAATESHDPNGGLNKQGKYIGAIYFRVSQIVIDEEPWEEFKEFDPNTYRAEINGEEELISLEEGESITSPVDIGTRGGGQIEIYRTEDDAKVRDSYLSSLGGLTNGAHYVKGSMVVRISDYLIASQQQKLIDDIFAALDEG